MCTFGAQIPRPILHLEPVPMKPLELAPCLRPPYEDRFDTRFDRFDRVDSIDRFLERDPLPGLGPDPLLDLSTRRDPLLDRFDTRLDRLDPLPPLPGLDGPLGRGW